MNRTSVARGTLRRAAAKLVLIALVASLGWAPGRAQGPIQMDLFVQVFFDVKAMDECMSRVKDGFTKAGYTDITTVETSGIRGRMASGDNAGVTSMATCFAGSAFILVLSSAGAGVAESAPQSQNSRLLNAIIR